MFPMETSAAPAMLRVYISTPARPITASMPFIAFLPGIEMFFLNIFPLSLPQATTEPVKAIAPMAIVKPNAMDENILMFLSVMYWVSATSKLESPPKPLNRATSCGIPVISTFFDQTAPMTPPRAIAAMTQMYAFLDGPKVIVEVTSFSKSTVTTAMSIPTEDSRLPFLAVSALPSSFMPRMKSTDDTMYSNVVHTVRILSKLTSCHPPFS